MKDSIPKRLGRPPRIPDDVWLDIEIRYVKGENTLKELAHIHSVNYATILDRSKLKRWPSPKRIAHALSRTDLPPQDAIKQIADKWAERKEQMREVVYKGSKRAVETFFALSPVPQDFAEAEKAFKLLEKSITPDEQKQDTNINLAILSSGFSPTPVVDI